MGCGYQVRNPWLSPEKLSAVSDEIKSHLFRLIAHSVTRYSTMSQLKAHPFFANVPWDNPRGREAPFVPALDSEIDTGYYDDFTSAEDMAKYAEVQEKQRNVERVREKEESFGRGVWVGFTFGKNSGVNQLVAKLASQTLEEQDENALDTIF